MSRTDELRLMVKVARMYYGQSIRQADITERLHIHQSTVSRLLKRAHESGIVRITVSMPNGVHADLEDEMEARFGLAEVLIVDSLNNEEQIVRDLGSAAAYFLETAVKPDGIVGISSWSAALLSMMDAMHPSKNGINSKVVQILGGLGNPTAQTHATQLTQRLAMLIAGSPVLLPAPGIVNSPETRRILMKEQYVRQATALFEKLDLALVGIGTLEPSRFLASSGNIFSQQELRSLSKQGAVGDICLQFYDREGNLIHSSLEERVIGIAMQQLRKCKRVVGVAGSKRKVAAIEGALRGKLIDVLITDRWTAETILASGKKA